MTVRSRRSAPFVLGVLAVLAVGAGVATATSHVFGAGGTLYACAHALEGGLRLVESADQCRPAEEAVHWNVQGPAGPPGPPGPGLDSLEALEGKACTVEADRQGQVVLTRFVPPLRGYASVNVFCMTTDIYEPNDTRAAAADVTDQLTPTGLLSLIGGTIYPAGDEDWFVIRAARFRRINVNLGLSVDVYRDGTLIASDLRAPAFIDDGADPHDWELHLRSTGGPAPVIVNLGPF